MHVKKTAASQSFLLNHYIFKISNVQSLAKTKSSWTPLFMRLMARSCRAGLCDYEPIMRLLQSNMHSGQKEMRS